jgi:imidazolonepropionase-like amidohydrolase
MDASPQLGQKLPVPAKAEVIDATGLSVYPGLIDAELSSA